MKRRGTILAAAVALVTIASSTAWASPDRETARTLDAMAEMTGQPAHILAAGQAWEDAGDVHRALDRYAKVVASPDATASDRETATAALDRLSAGGGHREQAAPAPPRPASPSSLQLQTTIPGRLELQITDARGARFACHDGWQAGGCRVDAAPGRARVRVSGGRTGTLWLEVGDAPDAHELRVLRSERLSSLQTIGVALTGMGAAGGIASLPIALAAGAGGGDAGAALGATLGVSAGLAAVGVALWLLMPPDRSEILSTRPIGQTLP